ncbi:MAG: RNA-processing protein, partial [Thermoprotei archaeon]
MSSVEPKVTKIYTKIPVERIGVLIGKQGEVKRELMRRTRTRITVDSVNGTVIIEPEGANVNPINLLKARDFVMAIAYGFSPERAFRILEEDQVLIVIDLKNYVGDKPNHIARVKARIIGEHGKARKTLEEMTGTYISVKESYVAIIGSYEHANVAREAIEMLIRGQRHSSV